MRRALSDVLQDPRLRRAAEYARDTDERTVGDQVRLTGIPAPPFREAERAEAMAGLMGEAGLDGVRSDEEGNVLALRPGSAALPPVVISAHLDTVFPPETPTTVRRDGDLLEGPGISDNGRGLAVLLAVARAMAAHDLTTHHPVLFAATVGEEGVGDLRGARHLVGPSGAGRGAAAFLAIDGAGLEQVVTRGLGSRRFRVVMRGAGGHSWTSRGTANPIHALANLVGSLALPPPPEGDEASFSVGRCGGGTSVNAIPEEAWLEIDCRSTSTAHLEAMGEHLRDSVARAASGYRDPLPVARRGVLETHVESLGFRPAGATDPDSRVVRAACAATEAVGASPRTALSSTDANAAMAVGIPAVTIGGGGEADLAHTTREWYRNVDGASGVVRALYALVLTAGPG